MNSMEEVTQQKLCVECGTPIIKQNAMDKRQKYCKQECDDAARRSRELKRYYNKDMTLEAAAFRRKRQTSYNETPTKKIYMPLVRICDSPGNGAWDYLDNKGY